MVAGSVGLGREGAGGGTVGLLILSVIAATVRTVAANSPPRFLLETNVGSEIVLRLREGPQQNNSILRYVSQANIITRLSHLMSTTWENVFKTHYLCFLPDTEN